MLRVGLVESGFWCTVFLVSFIVVWVEMMIVGVICFALVVAMG